MGQEKGEKFMSYLNSVTIIGFVGADPEQRQAGNNNGSKFTVLSVATQRSWKNADDEWTSKTEWHRVCVFRPRLAEYVATTIKKGSHVLVEGSLVSTTYERGNGKGKCNGPQSFPSCWRIHAGPVSLILPLERWDRILGCAGTISIPSAGHFPWHTVSERASLSRLPSHIRPVNPY
jgi:single-strand DNA-binding protein